MIKLQGEYITENGEIKFKVTDFKALELNKLPKGYTDGYPHCYTQFNLCSCRGFMPNAWGYSPVKNSSEVLVIAISPWIAPTQSMLVPKFLRKKNQQGKEYHIQINTVLTLDELDEVVPALIGSGERLHTLNTKNEVALERFLRIHKRKPTETFQI